jgi:hypothetical protein
MAGPKTADEARKAATGTSAVYAQANANPIGANRYDQDNIYSKIYFATDPYARNTLIQELYRGMASQPSTTGAGNLFNDLQTLLRKTNFSKGKTAIGIIDPEDITGLTKAIGGAIGMNAPDLFSYLSSIQASGGRATGKEVKKQDTTTRFTRQVTASLQMLDVGDATKKFTDEFFLAYGVLPNQDSIQSFQKAWNAEVRSQRQDTITEGKVEYAKVYDTKSKPVMDKATGKQKIDKFGQPVFSSLKKDQSGQPVYKPITTSKNLRAGQGFTEEEQAEFMADYLVSKFPDVPNVDSLGGVAKGVYDTIVKLDRDNFQPVSSFAAAAPLIKNAIGAGNQKVAEEYMKQYATSLRSNAAKKYMSVAKELSEGSNLADVAKPLIDQVSSALETQVEINDPLMVRMLNFQGANGEYRLPNEYERSQLIAKDKRFSQTSTAINSAVNTVQTLRNRLRG